MTDLMVWTFSSPEEHFCSTTVFTIKSLHLPSSEEQGLARDYHTKGFPEFDEIHYGVSSIAAQASLKSDQISESLK